MYQEFKFDAEQVIDEITLAVDSQLSFLAIINDPGAKIVNGAKSELTNSLKSLYMMLLHLQDKVNIITEKCKLVTEAVQHFSKVLRESTSCNALLFKPHAFAKTYKNGVEVTDQQMANSAFEMKRSEKK